MIEDYTPLATELIEAARPCFDDTDRRFVESNLGAGEIFYAADDALNAADRHDYPLPADLLDRVREWFDGVRTRMPDRDSTRFDRLLTAATTASSRVRAG